ncbi:hypothetical protein ACKFKF_06305 [Phormidesmis sp. 146-12]
MNLTARSTLLILLIINVVSTTIHYSDNAIYINQYPGPEWFTAIGVVLTVALMTPIGFLGYWFYTKNFFWPAYVFLLIYSITSLSSPGHYLFPAVMPMTLKMHVLIWLDAIAGLSLLSFVLWSTLFLQEWRLKAYEE